MANTIYRPTPTTSNATVVDTLNSLLRGELAAVETFGQAIAKFGSACPSELHACQRSHEKRVELLARRISELGGEAAESSGLWGGFAKLMEGGAKLFGRQPALAMLEEGEDHGLKLYDDAIPKLDAESRRLVEEELLHEQNVTHQVMRVLKQQKV